MGGKGRRRREARRRARQRQEERRQGSPPEQEGIAAEVAAGPTEEAVYAAEAGHSRAVRKRAKRRGGPWARVRRLRLSPWLLAVPLLAVGITFVVVGVVRGGSSGTTGSGAEPTPDPRVAGLPIDVSFDIEAGDDGSRTGSGSFFQPDSFTADAGDVVEFKITNTGSVSHNLWVSGPDKEYETDDDFGPSAIVTPGKTGRLVVKIDDPGTYPFRCQIHPNLQVGTLVLG